MTTTLLLLEELSAERIAVRAVIWELSYVGDKHDIAHYLHDRGVRGYRMSASFCPVARYVAEMTGYLITTSRIGWSVMNFPGTYPVPPNIGNFIADFDRGLFPELEEAHP